jgi:hypothetical protein
MKLPTAVTPDVQTAYNVLMADTESPIGPENNARWALAVEGDPTAWANALLALARELRGY